jgi:UPF0755 protein
MSRLIPAFVVALAVAVVAVFAWVIAVIPGTILGSEPTAFLGPTPGTGTVQVSISDGEGAKVIADDLQKAGVIESARLFRVLVAFMGIEDQLIAGDYEFDKGMVTLTVIDRIHNGITAPLMVTVPEGLRIEEVGALMEKKGVVSASDFVKAAEKTDYDYTFLQDLPDGDSLEGYLFPATYGFSRSVTAEEVVQQMLTAFDNKVMPEVEPEVEGTGLTLHQVITLASIVEREAVKPEERPLIASVFLNRLKVGMALQADPTVQYALAADPESVASYGYWKQELTTDDLQVDSPYNTYKSTALPPGPIASPGLDSIRAVLRPARTNYLFFVAKDDGSHAFAETLQEQLQNIQRYQP